LAKAVQTLLASGASSDTSSQDYISTSATSVIGPHIVDANSLACAVCQEFDIASHASGVAGSTDVSSTDAPAGLDVNDEVPHAVNVQLVPELEVMHKEVPVREEYHKNTEFRHDLADYNTIRHAAYKLGCFEAAVAALENALEDALASGISPAPPLHQSLSQLVHIAADKVKHIETPAKEAEKNPAAEPPATESLLDPAPVYSSPKTLTP
jgi:hypothetical protein